MRRAQYEVHDRHSAVPGDEDRPFPIARVLHEMQDYDDALQFVEASPEQHGPDAATEHDLALCKVQLD